VANIVGLGGGDREDFGVAWVAGVGLGTEVPTDEGITAISC